MPAASSFSTTKPKATKHKNAGEKKLSGKLKRLKYYTHGYKAVSMYWMRRRNSSKVI